jgi:glycosyltransferase involved in cell wall biosynthesis
MHHPIISVIIPTYNRLEMIPYALRSVLLQGVEGVEIIVVDDASTEDISELLRTTEFSNVRIIRRARRGGAAAARNTGIKEAFGKYIAFLDSDDEWLPGKLERQLRFMQTRPDVRLTCTAFCIVHPNTDGEPRFLDHATYGTSELAFGCGLSPGSTLLTDRSLFDEIGIFDEKMPRLEDWDWLLRATDVSLIGIVNVICANIHVGSYPMYPEVKISTERLHIQQYPRVRRAGWIYGMRFNAAIHLECAVSAYRSKTFIATFWHYILSTMYYPFRGISHYKRILKKIFE